MSTLPAAVDPRPAEPTTIATNARKGFVTLGDLERICLAQPTNYIVEGLLPADDVHVAVGDSGLGKTPWAYQLGLSVVTGKPFLGFSVRQGRVLYYDLENGREEILQVGRSLCAHLGVASFPDDFLVLLDEGNPVQLAHAVNAQKPALVIVDTLRALKPTAQKANEEMAAFLNECKAVARKHHCAILLLHHIKKPSENGVSSLEITPIMEWLLQASGARALINQTNTRIAFDAPAPAKRDSDAVLVMKSFVKMRGEGGPFHLARVLDSDGEPIGYRRMVGCELLGNEEQEAAFRRLPDPPKQFTFKEAKRAYGATDNPTSQWLKKCEAAGLTRRVARGVYEKVVDVAPVSLASVGNAEVTEVREKVPFSVADGASVGSEGGMKNAA
jgi:hypothetical protein